MENSIVFFCVEKCITACGRVGGIMNFKIFCEKLYTAISEFYGNEVTLELKEVRKNNGVILTGLMFHEGDESVSPAIYMDSYYQEYEYGKEIDRIIMDIINIYEKVRKNPKVDMEFFTEYDAVKERICYKIINYKKNEDLLKECPHIKFLNLAITFYYAYINPVLGKGSIMIKNTHKEEWNVSTEELFRQANDNTKRLFPYEILGIEDLLEELVGGEFLDEGMSIREEMLIPMYVVTNKNRYMGAISIMYPGLLAELARKEDANLFLLPSSIHEFIILADTGQDTEDLLKMVREVNESRVAEEEILSNSVYYYDKISEKIELLM